MTVISLKKRLHGCILDVGGGGEGVIGRLYPRQVVAIDNDANELMDAPGDFERLLMDATKLTFPDAFFDAATFFYSLMFMTADEQRAALIHLSVKWAEQQGGEKTTIVERRLQNESKSTN